MTRASLPRMTCRHCGTSYWSGDVPYQTRALQLCPDCDNAQWFGRGCRACRRLPSGRLCAAVFGADGLRPW